MSPEKKCNSCLCYDRETGFCQVNILINDKKLKLPVFPDDSCHYISLGVSVEQIRLWEEEKQNGEKVVKIEYPVGFFGSDDKNLTKNLP